LILLVLDLKNFYTTCTLQALIQKFLSLGVECVKIQETIDASQGISLVLVTLALLLFDLLSPMFLWVSDVFSFALQLPWSPVMLAYQL
jgi:hypothetical protein